MSIDIDKLEALAKEAERELFRLCTIEFMSTLCARLRLLERVAAKVYREDSSDLDDLCSYKRLTAALAALNPEAPHE